ncbi:polysaccharide biosynthesis protein [Cyclobacterium jeungdonense]|uniref:Polysaccharide biosynthesis protein n=1 Tax=Cyclobacterium jeungdonense TaxID=708087 RepID=A0ABT8CAT4_9BACT|nr:polysaccharide biosynthesis protein [Cyclobacterium jeungdonense]MDN3688875.1 polysaccharide biosynthesis protein [Cyclobacterium jeungdonense]
MNELYNYLTTGRKFAKVREWGKIISITGSAQVVIQAIGFISGILVIRVLPVHEYAIYTLANTILGTMTLLADGGGISTGVMSQGGPVWNDNKKLGQILSTGLVLRKKFAGVTLILAIPALVYLLRNHQVTWGMTIAVSISVIPMFYLSLSSSIYDIIAKLRQEIIPLQKIQVLTNFGRLFLTFSLLLFPLAFIAISISGLSQAWNSRKLKNLAKPYAQLTDKVDLEVKKNILAIVKRTLPGALFYSLSGQITLWLISFFGSTEGVAQIGALGRIGMVLSIFTSMFGTLIVPRFARLSNDYQILLKRYVQFIIILFCVCLSLVTLVSLFSDYFLLVLGNKYFGLNNELCLYILGSSIGLVSGGAYQLIASRGWILNPIISISLNILFILLGVSIFDISSLIGVIIFGVFLSCLQLIMNGSYGILKIFNLKCRSNQFN